MAVFWDIVPCSLVEVYRRLALMMEAKRGSVTALNFLPATRRTILEDSHLHKVALRT
jgi:hypothetical protein